MRNAIPMAVLALCALPMAARAVEQWGRHEVVLQTARAYANPFTDVRLTAEFRCGDHVLHVTGFCDGPRTFKLRLMPTVQGTWTYVTRSNDPGLDGRRGQFECGRPGKGNHGPVRVAKTYHFDYADGIAYFQVGTTCYAWAHQGDRRERQTLATLAEAPFNKIRMCVFPKHYTYCKNEPKHYPFEGRPPRKWNFARFNPAFWRHFERRVGQLCELGIEADLILFHPYDRWGFANMPAEADDRYLRYVVARLAAFRNVWWSFANEFDLMKAKKTTDWNRFFRIVQQADPYDHLRSIHNCRRWYDHAKPWVTHASIQSSDFRRAVDHRAKYRKPIVYDECKYEGDIPQGWGNISAQEMVHRFWLGAASGCYVGHGETYKHPRDILWWSKGGVLHGRSPARIAFFRRVFARLPFQQMQPSRALSRGNYAVGKPGEVYLIYFLDAGCTKIRLPKGKRFRAELIDTWKMKITGLPVARGPTFSFTPPAARHALLLTAEK